MNKNKSLAFTLAEVLIVIGIIGVVAALTLPNLNHATGDKEKVTKVKKIYSALTEAVDRAQVIYGNADTWFANLDCGGGDYEICEERLAKRITEFLKISKDCEFGDGCWKNISLLDSKGEVLFDNCLDEWGQPYTVTLSDGISLAFLEGTNKIKVDIDGPNKGKNQVGNDIFDFSLYTSKSKANDEHANLNQLYPSVNSYVWTNMKNLNQENSPGNCVTAWVIENENLDYLKCYDELNWETKTSCE